MNGVCNVHAEATAGFQCTGCGALLCEACVDVGTHLLMCGLCGERVIALSPEAAKSLVPTAHRRAEPVRVLRTTSGEAADLSTVFFDHLTHHVAVPSAIIAMVVALLFFLVDLRSIFLPYGLALKWLGLCFAVATVLIVRYGKASGNEDRRGLYSAMLGGATVIALWASPWDAMTSGAVGPLANTLILFVVWRFATLLTTSLSREGEVVVRPGGLVLYGVERLELEAWERRQEEEGRPLLRRLRERRAKASADAHGNPSAAVARLVAAALVLFALAEPLILSGPPEVGIRALAAVVVFLMASGVVLAVGSAVGTLRLARRLGAQTSEGWVPRRAALAAGLVVVLLAMALAVPGITYRGSGELGPRTPVGGEEGSRQDENAQDTTTDDGQSQQTSAGEQAQRPLTEASTALLDLVALVGRWLWIPFAVLVAVLALVALARLAPFLAGRPEMAKGWRSLLARLAAVLGGRRRGRAKDHGERRRVDLSLDGFDAMRPSEAAMTAYLRLLDACAAAGYPRPEKQTPYEYLAGLPAHLRSLREPFAVLTDLYVRAAYAGDELGDAERREVLSSLASCKRGLPRKVA